MYKYKSGKLKVFDVKVHQRFIENIEKLGFRPQYTITYKSIHKFSSTNSETGFGCVYVKL